MASQLANVLTGIPAIPAVVTRTHDIQKFVAALQRRLSGIPRARYLSFLKLCAFLVLLVNAGSLPFAWHCRSSQGFLATQLKPYFHSPRVLAYHCDQDPIPTSTHQIVVQIICRAETDPR